MTSGEDPQLETIRIEAEKISQKGKARFRAEDGAQGFVEEIALHHFHKEGWSGVWGENDLWSTLMTLLFWDVIFARIDGVWTPQFGSFPSPLQDMPQDMFKPEFYQRRARLIEQRLENLHRADLESEVRNSLHEHYGQPCRLIYNWDKFDADHLAHVVALVPRDALLGILHVLLQDFNGSRSGLGSSVRLSQTPRVRGLLRAHSTPYEKQNQQTPDRDSSLPLPRVPALCTKRNGQPHRA